MSYTTFRAVPAFVRREADGELFTCTETRAVDDATQEIAGLRSASYPLRLEWFFSQSEPIVNGRRPRRVVFWQPDEKRSRPRGWLKLPFPSGLRCTGYTDVGDGKEYWEAWPKESRYARRRWLEHSEYEIRDATLEEFEAGFARAHPSDGLFSIYSGVLRKKVAQHSGLMRFRCVWHPSSDVPVGGTGVMLVPEAKAAVLISSFYHRSHADSCIGTGLIDDWFAQSITVGFQYMDFDLFWAPGDPGSWKGYSHFKQKFNTTLIRYPHPFFRILL